MVLNLWVDEWFTESTETRNVSHNMLPQFLRDQRPHTRHPDEPARDTISNDDSGFIHDQSRDYGSGDSFVYDNELDHHNYVDRSESPHPYDDEPILRPASISPPLNDNPIFQEHWGDRIRTQEYFGTPSASVTPGTTTTLPNTTPNTTIAPSSLALNPGKPSAAQATSHAANTPVAHVAPNTVSNPTSIASVALDTRGIPSPLA
jgi:hypothetical protein